MSSSHDLEKGNNPSTTSPENDAGNNNNNSNEQQAVTFTTTPTTSTVVNENNSDEKSSEPNEKTADEAEAQPAPSAPKSSNAAVKDVTPTSDNNIIAMLGANPHTMESSAVIEKFDVVPALGLSPSVVQDRLAKYGPNRLKPPQRPSLLKIFWRQVLNAMTIVLIAAMAVSFGTQDWISGGVIFALVALNVGTGTVQEWKAEKTVAALESVGSPVATVLRNPPGKRQHQHEGKVETINVEDVVPGDIILLKNGDVVPADARVIDGQMSNLECDEALLTGESLPVVKITEVIEESNCPVGDRTNMVFSGSQVTKGRARCVVTGVGMQTELGKIAEALERKESIREKGWRAKWYKFKVAMGVAGTTPLQMKMNKLAYLLLFLAIILAIVVVATTAFVDVPLTIATYAVATAVSLLPASLVAVVSLTLATASRELAKRNALVRRMDAVETLAAVSNVCSDKTGTITVGKMVLRKAWVPVEDNNPRDTHTRAPVNTDRGQLYDVESGRDPFYPRGTVVAVDTDNSVNKEQTDSSDEDDDVAFHSEDIVHHNKMERALKDLLLCGSLCNVASIHHNSENDEWEANGDPTEVALQVFAHKLGHGKPHLTHIGKVRSRGDDNLSRTVSTQSDPNKPPMTHKNGHFEQLVEHPFDSTVKRMATAYRFVPGDNEEDAKPYVIVFMKGAVERVLERCSHVGLGDDKEELNDHNKDNIISKMDQLAEEGLRVLSLSARIEPIERAQEIATLPRDELESGLNFVGLVGIYDPPRPESAGAVAECNRAGVIPRMLTGDHPATAKAIAIQVGIIAPDHEKSAVMTGQQFDELTEDEIDALPELPRVIARCAPETKVRMVEAIHRRKMITIMTGDGVNDSPALKRADVGVAMGLNGSDVAKQAAEIVLADDRFDTIVRAVRKGRSIFMNLSKFLLYLLSGNVAEVLVLMVGLSFRDENDISTFPLSPVAALWINTLAAGPPALALGLEPTAKNAMIKPPSEFATIFTVEWFCDLFFYGITIGALALINFVIVVFGKNDGQLGMDCNEDENSTCNVVFRGRATCFSTLVILLMFHSLECKQVELSLFQTDLLDNKMLLWCVVFLSAVTFPIVYIPVINDYVFMLTGLGWEWGIVFAAILVYFVLAEIYKLIRRIPKREQYKKQMLAEKEDEETPNKKELKLEDTVAPGF